MDEWGGKVSLEPAMPQVLWVRNTVDFSSVCCVLLKINRVISLKYAKTRVFNPKGDYIRHCHYIVLRIIISGPL